MNGTTQDNGTLRLPPLPDSADDLIPAADAVFPPPPPRVPAMAPPSLPPLADKPYLPPTPQLSPLPRLTLDIDIDAAAAVSDSESAESDSGEMSQRDGDPDSTRAAVSLPDRENNPIAPLSLPSILESMPQIPTIDTAALTSFMEEHSPQAVVDSPTDLVRSEAETQQFQPLQIESPLTLSPEVPEPAAEVPWVGPASVEPDAAAPSAPESTTPLVPTLGPDAAAPSAPESTTPLVPTLGPDAAAPPAPESLAATPSADVTPAAVPSALPASALPASESPAAEAEVDAIPDPSVPTFDAPLQSDGGLPSLPSLAPVMPAPVAAGDATGPHHPSQAAMQPLTGLPQPVAPVGKKSAKASGRGAVRTVVRTLFLIGLAGGVGVGAHLGYDYWQGRDLELVEGAAIDGADLASWPIIDPPAIRYADTVTTFTDAAGTRKVTSHTELASGSKVADVKLTDSAGLPIAQVEVEVRGDEAALRYSADDPWTPVAPADAEAALGGTWSNQVLSVRDLFPVAALPYITVLESVERVLPVNPLDVPAATAGPETDSVPAPTPESTTTPAAASSAVWQYRVLIDIEAFRERDPVAFQDWQRRVGSNAVPRLEASVDGAGIVRQVAVERDGVTIVQTLVAGDATSEQFDTALPLAPDATAADPLSDAPAEADAEADVEAGVDE